MNKRIRKIQNKLILILLLTLNWQISAEQETGIISGTIIQEENNDPLPGANIIIVGTNIGAAADFNGLYALQNLPPGEYELRITMIGYKPIVEKVTLKTGDNLEKNFALVNTTVDLPEVVVSAERLAERTSVSDISFSRMMMRNKHGLVEDPIQVIRSMPGVSTSDDLFSPSQLYVRGGGPDENLFLLDWTRVYWPWYMGGIKSIFNTDVVNEIELLTGGFPAKYGNILSSVLNVTTREGNQERLAGGFTFGLMNTQFLLEGPLGEKANFLATGRRTYLDLIMGESAEFPVPTFYDINLKATYKPSLNQTIEVNGFLSYENMNFIAADPQPGMPDRIINDSELNTQSFIWNSILGEKLYSKLVLTRSYSLASVDVGRNFKLEIDAEDIGFREDLTWKITPVHEIKIGVELSRSNFLYDATLPLDPSVMDPTDSTVIQVNIHMQDKTAGDGAYIQDSWKISGNLEMTGGLRYDYFSYNRNSNISPRLSARYALSKKTSLRTAWGKYYQPPVPEQLSEAPQLKSRLATHYIVGLSHNFNRSLSGWTEIYYKDYDQLITIDTTQTPYVYANDGIGYSRGIEFFLQKSHGSFNGWISYALSESKRREFLAKNETYFSFDQRHLLSVVMEYHLPDPGKFNPAYIEFNFRFSSGKPYTPVIRGEQNPNGGWHPVYGSHNSERETAYLNLNLRFGWKYKIMGKYNAESFFEIWNILNRKNILGRTYQYGEEYENFVNVQPYYTTPIIPAGGFSVEF